MNEQSRQGFWHEAFARQGSVVPRVLPLVRAFGLIAIAIWGLARLIQRWFHILCVLEITPFEFAGAALGVLLVFRTNAEYDRCWEARKLWGGFVDRCRNITISALTYPLLSLDQLGVELENPFATENLSHLPLGQLSSSIEENVLALLPQPAPWHRLAS